MRPFNTRLLFRTTCCCLIGLFLFLGLSCDKKEDDTMVRGKILDAETMLPIEGAVIIYRNRTSNNDGSNPVYESHVFTTKADGQYTITYPYYSGDFVKIYKDPGYLSKVHPINFRPTIQEGRSNDLDIMLTPLNGFIKLVVRNINGMHNKIYIWATDDIIESEFGIDQGLAPEKYPLIQSAGSEYSTILRINSNTPARVKWRFEDQAVAPIMVQSILVEKNDTATCLIEY